MTKYLKIALFAMIGIMFSGVAQAVITSVWDEEPTMLTGSRKKGELKCDNITTFSAPQSGKDCKLVTLSDNVTKCFECSCSQKNYPYTKDNCSGKLVLDSSSSSCTDPRSGKKYYKTCECGEGLLTAEEAKKYGAYFNIGSPVQSAGNLACYDPKKFTCKNASNKITADEILTYHQFTSKTVVQSKNEPVVYEVATNISASNKSVEGLVMCVKRVDQFIQNVSAMQPKAQECVETSTGTTKFLNTAYYYYSGCNTTKSGCQESSHPCVEEKSVVVNGYSASTKEAKTFSCSRISGCKIGKQGDSLCDRAPATDNPDLVYNKDNGCAQISCSANYKYIESGTGETSFNDAKGDLDNTNYTYVSKEPDATSDGWIVCSMENPTKGKVICPAGATSTADGKCECINRDKKLVTDENGKMYCDCIKEGYYDDPSDGEDKCIVDPNSDVMQCPEPSILNEDTGECICADSKICTLDCVDGKYELCGNFQKTATDATCTDLTWDNQKQMFLCKTGSTTFTATVWDCIETEITCKQSACTDGYEIVSVNGKDTCMAPCSQGQTRNTTTGECVSSTTGSNKGSGCAGASDYNYCMCGKYGYYYHASTGKCTTSPTNNSGSGTANDALIVKGGGANTNTLEYKDLGVDVVYEKQADDNPSGNSNDKNNPDNNGGTTGGGGSGGDIDSGGGGYTVNTVINPNTTNLGNFSSNDLYNLKHDHSTVGVNVGGDDGDITLAPF